MMIGPDEKEVNKAASDLSQGLPVTKTESFTHFLGVGLENMKGATV